MYYKENEAPTPEQDTEFRLNQAGTNMIMQARSVGSSRWHNIVLVRANGVVARCDGAQAVPAIASETETGMPIVA